MKRIKITILDTSTGASFAYITASNGAYINCGDYHCSPSGPGGIITKIELVLEAPAIATVDTTAAQ